MMDAARLRSLAQDRFLELWLYRSKDDQRSADQMRRIAAKQVVREQRIAAKSQTPPHSQITTANAFETLFNRIWKIVSNQRLYAELMQRRSLQTVCKLQITPTIDANPIIADEPITTNIVQFPKAAPLVVAGNGGAKLIEDEEFIPRFIDQTTSNWRASIQQNQAIAKEREARSIQHRNQSSRWIG
jgi:hypothetical protein